MENVVDSSQPSVSTWIRQDSYRPYEPVPSVTQPSASTAQYWSPEVTSKSGLSLSGTS